jgi:hypothetical protein
MPSHRPTNCAQLIAEGVVAAGNADISGTGVIIAFILSACLTIVAVLGAYLCGMVDDGLLRPVDRFILRIPSRAANHPTVHVALRKLILALSDQQIVTGIAILGAGFAGMRDGSITVYHFHLVVYLAWMSSSVHLSALTILRPWLYYHRGVLAWRLAGMLILLVMLMVALIPTVSNEWGVVSIWTGPLAVVPPKTSFGAPAICFWGNSWGNNVNPDSVLSFLVLGVSYLWKAGGIWMPVRRTFAVSFRNPIDGTLEAMLVGVARSYDKNGGRWRMWMFRACLAIYLPIVAILETLGSFSAALWVSVLGLIFGVMQIIIPRQLMQTVNQDLAENEKHFGFGQLVPLILLVQPLGAVLEHIWLKHQDDEPLYVDPYSHCLAAYQQGNELVGSTDKPLLQFMASYYTPPRTELAPQRLELKGFLYTSKLFHSLVWLIHLAVAATSAVVFYVDYLTIGYTTTGSWLYITYALGGWTALALVIVLILAPYSRLGRYWKRERPGSVAPAPQEWHHDGDDTWSKETTKVKSEDPAALLQVPPATAHDSTVHTPPRRLSDQGPRIHEMTELHICHSCPDPSHRRSPDPVFMGSTRWS